MERLACDVHALPADAATLDALARLQLAARRCGLELHVCEASAELRCLITFSGLDEALRVEPGRQTEERKERLRIEEERQLPDPPAS